MDDLFIARQPIYNKKLIVMGYELLYRCSTVNEAIFEDGTQASCQTIVNAFMHIGVETITGSAMAFINLPEHFILNEELTLMFKEQCVLEIIEDIEPTPAVIVGLKNLKSRGFKLALDDFIFTPKHQPFVELADFIKMDVLSLTEQEIQEQLSHIKGFKGELIAEKVETQEMYKLCQQYPFDHFQGYFFCHPEVVSQAHIPANKMVLLNALNKLQDPELDFDELEAILAQDVSLSYKLIRYVNSATFSLRREIDSIKDVVVLLGIKNVKNWITLIMMSSVSAEKPVELISTALVRAKMCELLAQKFYPDISSHMFIAGLFTVLDALMDMSLEDLMDTVTLNIDIKMALLFREGQHGEIINQVLAYERSDWDGLNSATIPPSACIETYLAALKWADESTKALA
ncbi:MAG: HDOD domain-containing protein [Methylococcales bacterium]|jgi:c-di-GMP phosphodiesterase|nr:HDOD domain-containing protein [Methylococcales bacterium]MBT7443490.1 HDOD domain-containing protein [Methylococcales bacterium]